MKQLAAKYLKLYRMHRAAGRSVRIARINALFSIATRPGGRSNLFVQNRARKYNQYWKI